jgi:anti-sigma-K factor RskA
VAPQAPELEQRLSELQSQLDRISEVLNTWTTLGERQAHVINELEARVTSWNALDTRFEQDAERRLHELARIIEHEWRALRQIHQEPVNELRDQAVSLTEVSLATASAAQTSFDRAEARLSALETTIHNHMTELARDVHTAIASMSARADMQPSGQMPPVTPAPAWPLDGVMRLHSQLREDDAAPGNVPAVRTLPAPSDIPLLSERLDSLERSLEDERAAIKDAAARTDRASRTWQVAVVLLALGFVAAGGFAWWLQRQANAAAARAAAAERQSQLATDAANQRIEIARTDAARQISQARDSAVRAQVVSDVLAAPDLVRVLLTGGDETTGKFAGQLLWSRSRGLVFSSSRLPPPSGGMYQLWLTTATQPVSVRVFTPDAAGSVTIATDNPPRPPSVNGALVTLEPEGGSPSPTGPTFLARAP